MRKLQTALHVKNEEVEHLVRTLARNRGISVTEAIGVAVSETLAADRSAVKEPASALQRKLQPLFDEMAAYGVEGRLIDSAFQDE